MRLSLKFSIGLAIGMALLLVTQATWHAQDLATLQRQEARAELAVLGRALGEGCAAIFRSGDSEDVQAFIDRVDARRDHVRVSLHAFDASADGVSPPEPAAEGWRVRLLVPVVVDGRTVASVLLERSQPGWRSHLSTVRRTQVTTAFAMVLVAGAIAIGLGYLLVGKPVQALSDFAHRIAGGDFSRPSEVSQRDELGGLARDLDAMALRLKESQDSVRSERRARTAALEKLRHADRLTTVGKLASSVAHELGTPLNVVSGCATMIVDDPAVPEQAREQAKVVVEQSQRMTAIIQELLGFSRRHPLARRDVAAGDLLHHAALLMEPVCEDHGVTLRVGGDGDATAHIDQGKAMQVLTNMIMNAIHAMPRGGTIELRAERARVSSPTDPHAAGPDFLRVDVRDDGVGIPPERIEGIFQPFMTSRAAEGGTGLGLHICHGIVREHGGFIEVASEVGKGTCFSIYWPERDKQ